MHFISHVHFFSFLCYSFLAARILSQAPRQAKNYIAGLSFLCFALWSFSFVFIHHHATPHSHAVLWLDISSIGGLLYPAILLWFSLHLLGQKHRFLSWGAGVVGLALLILQFRTHSIAVIAGPNPSGPGWDVQFLKNTPNVIYGIFVGIVTPLAIVFPIIVAIDRRRLRIERKRSMLILFGVMVSFGSGWAYSFLANQRGWSGSLFFDALFLPLAICIYVAIRKYRLLGPTLESVYKGIVGSMAEAVILTDMQGRITYANDAAFRLFHHVRPLGNRRLSAILSETGSTHVDTLLGPDDYHNKSIALETGNNGHTDLLVTRTSPGEAVGGSYYLFSDITQHTKAQHELERAERLRGLEIFSGGIAHDLNNLLTGIMGYLDLALESGVSQREKLEYLTKARNTFPNMVSLTGRLLTLSKWGYKTSSPTNPAPVLREAAELALSGSAISLICNFEEDLHPVNMDQGQLTQIINNLVVNARQALGKNGKVQISAVNVSCPPGPSVPAQELVRITVEDNGKGIEDSVKRKIFEPFFTTKADGSGLGLATSRSLIKNQGGSIEVFSAPGEGTTFVLDLPATRGFETPIPSRDDTLSMEYTNNEKALVLDDEPGIRMLITDMLELVGCQVTAVPDGDAAIAAAQSAICENAPFTLGILDLTIPGGTGAVEIAPTLKAFDPNISLVLSTGYSDKDLSELKYSGSFAAVLNKPYNFREIKTLLHTIRLQREPST